MGTHQRSKFQGQREHFQGLSDQNHGKNSPLDLKCLFGDSENPSIASNIFVDTRSIKIIIAPPPSGS